MNAASDGMYVIAEPARSLEMCFNSFSSRPIAPCRFQFGEVRVGQGGTSSSGSRVCVHMHGTRNAVIRTRMSVHADRISLNAAEGGGVLPYFFP